MKINIREAVIISAYTRVNFLAHNFIDMHKELHKYAEEKLQRPVFFLDMASEEFWAEFKIMAEDDFLKIIKDIEYD